MKKMNKYILWLLPVFGLFACEDEMEVYNSPENRLNFIYEPYTMADTVILVHLFTMLKPGCSIPFGWKLKRWGMLKIMSVRLRWNK